MPSGYWYCKQLRYQLSTTADLRDVKLSPSLRFDFPGVQTDACRTEALLPSDPSPEVADTAVRARASQALTSTLCQQAASADLDMTVVFVQELLPLLWVPPRFHLTQCYPLVTDAWRRRDRRGQEDRSGKKDGRRRTAGSGVTAYTHQMYSARVRNANIHNRLPCSAWTWRLEAGCSPLPIASQARLFLQILPPCYSEGSDGLYFFCQRQFLDKLCDDLVRGSFPVSLVLLFSRRVGCVSGILMQLRVCCFLDDSIGSWKVFIFLTENQLF